LPEPYHEIVIDVWGQTKEGWLARPAELRDMWPIQRPVAFSMTENIAKPWIAQAPAIDRNPRHATGRG
jgi:hypothetical protein